MHKFFKIESINLSYLSIYLIINWRFHEIAFIADIQKMYRQMNRKFHINRSYGVTIHPNQFESTA